MELLAEVFQQSPLWARSGVGKTGRAPVERVLAKAQVLVPEAVPKVQAVPLRVLNDPLFVGKEWVRKHEGDLLLIRAVEQTQTPVAGFVVAELAV